MIHEVGHLLYLGDVYIDTDKNGPLPSNLQNHPPAIMGNTFEVEGKIQKDDIEGLHQAITSVLQGNLQCGQGYDELDNTIDIRSRNDVFCVPSKSQLLRY